MPNIFAPYIDPRKSAKSLDSKRLARICHESLVILSAVIQNDKTLKKYHSKVYSPPKSLLNHPITRWCSIRLHFMWLLDHIDELNTQYVLRYKKEDNCKPYNDLYKLMCKLVDKIPTSLLNVKYSDEDTANKNYFKIYFPRDNFTHNTFNYSFNKKKEGKCVLPPNTTYQTRCKLALMHKWLYLDVRDVSWHGANVPIWVFNPLYRDFLKDNFGKIKNKLPIFKPNSADYVKSLASVVDDCGKLTDIGIKLTNKFKSTIYEEHEELVNGRNRTSSAVFSRNKKYRYFLSRQWSTLPPLVVCMLNPSTADVFKNDPTVARIEALAEKLNCGGYLVLNICAYRATKPEDMLDQDDPYGVHNLQIIEYSLKQVVHRWRYKPKFLLAYGNNVKKLDNGIKFANRVNTLAQHCSKIQVLQMTKAGLPQHPLYISSKKLPERYAPW